jgi:hypothetical protein
MVVPSLEQLLANMLARNRETRSTSVSSTRTVGEK